MKVTIDLTDQQVETLKKGYPWLDSIEQIVTVLANVEFVYELSIQRQKEQKNNK